MVNFQGAVNSAIGAIGVTNKFSSISNNVKSTNNIVKNSDIVNKHSILLKCQQIPKQNISEAESEAESNSIIKQTTLIEAADNANAKTDAKVDATIKQSQEFDDLKNNVKEGIPMRQANPTHSSYKNNSPTKFNRSINGRR